MSTTSFDDIDKEKEKSNKKSSKKAELAKPAGGELSTGSAKLGNVDSEDINIDHIQILGRSSQFEVDEAEIGDICFNKEKRIVGEGEAVKAVVVHMRKYWKEDVPFGEDVMPRFANTPEQKEQLEATTEYDKVIPVCEIKLLIERPDSFTDDTEAAGVFLYEFGGKEYALVQYTVQKPQAVRENYGTINTVMRAQATKGANALAHYFLLRSKEKGQGTRYKWHQFVLSGSTEAAPEGAVSFAAGLRGE